MKIKKWAGMVTAGTLISAGVLMGMASAAHALPAGCSWTQEGYRVTSQCAGGTGQHRVVVNFIHVNPWVGPAVMESQWAYVGNHSSINVLGTVTHVRVETKD
ncbi:hypothetical protein [Sinosporangium siamense]|uniref:Uncharacterized protein n=1 Tax=Sinosporangium siamense TaxID=1367973 RepID=A0A919REN6_9ACTN|nr:hypothetical protein [Sinosporangium siamense]GII91019.1 hypothetical protein Ssi02_12500 [Sinosporangium siamense]